VNAENRINLPLSLQAGERSQTVAHFHMGISEDAAKEKELFL